MLQVLFLVYLRTQGCVQVRVPQARDTLINEPETPLPNLNPANISSLGLNSQFKDHQYFRLYGSYCVQALVAVYMHFLPAKHAVYLLIAGTFMHTQPLNTHCLPYTVCVVAY